MNVYLKLHLMTIVPVLLLGPYILLRKKGDRPHIPLGRIWACLMIVSCVLTFGITHDGGYSWLHGLSAFTLYQVFRGILAIRKKDVNVHRRAMLGSYIGAVTAFLFASLVPGRLLSNWINQLLS